MLIINKDFPPPPKRLGDVPEFNNPFLQAIADKVAEHFENNLTISDIGAFDEIAIKVCTGDNHWRECFHCELSYTLDGNESFCKLQDDSLVIEYPQEKEEIFYNLLKKYDK